MGVYPDDIQKSWWVGDCLGDLQRSWWVGARTLRRFSITQRIDERFLRLRPTSRDGGALRLSVRALGRGEGRWQIAAPIWPEEDRIRTVLASCSRPDGCGRSEIKQEKPLSPCCLYQKRGGLPLISHLASFAHPSTPDHGACRLYCRGNQI